MLLTAISLGCCFAFLFFLWSIASPQPGVPALSAAKLAESHAASASYRTHAPTSIASRRFALFFNPVSGKKQGEHIAHQVQTHLEKAGGVVTLHRLSSKLDTLRAPSALKLGAHDALVLIGGDGTLSGACVALLSLRCSACKHVWAGVTWDVTVVIYVRQAFDVVVSLKVWRPQSMRALCCMMRSFASALCILVVLGRCQAQQSVFFISCLTTCCSISARCMELFAGCVFLC